MLLGKLEQHEDAKARRSAHDAAGTVAEGHRVFKYAALATDYDGTIASDGRVDEPTVAALARARACGVRLLLITGRELADVFNVFDRHTVFDFIVAENGAVLFDVAGRVTEDLGGAPPPNLLSLLAAQRVPVSVGRSIP